MGHSNKIWELFVFHPQPDVSRIIRQFNIQWVLLVKKSFYSRIIRQKTHYILFYINFIVFNIFLIFYQYNIFFIYIMWNELFPNYTCIISERRIFDLAERFLNREFVTMIWYVNDNMHISSRGLAKCDFNVYRAFKIDVHLGV
jgi:hypothetical protein